MSESIITEAAFCNSFDRLRQDLFRTHQDKGWTQNSKPEDRVWQGNQIALMHGELSEAHEAIRKDLNDDKLTHRKGVEVELADVIIRIMNFATETGLDVAGALVEKARYNQGREFMHGGKKF